MFWNKITVLILFQKIWSSSETVHLELTVFISELLLSLELQENEGKICLQHDTIVLLNILLFYRPVITSSSVLSCVPNKMETKMLMFKNLVSIRDLMKRDLFLFCWGSGRNLNIVQGITSHWLTQCVCTCVSDSSGSISKVRCRVMQFLVWTTWQSDEWWSVCRGSCSH